MVRTTHQTRHSMAERVTTSWLQWRKIFHPRRTENNAEDDVSQKGVAYLNMETTDT